MARHKAFTTTIAAALLLATSLAATQELSDLVENEIESTISDGIEDQLDTQTIDAVERQVEDTVISQAEQQVEASVDAEVSGQVEGQVEAQVESQVEGNVTGQVEAGVEQQLTGSIEASAETQLESQLTQQVESAVSGQLEAGLEQQLTGSVEAGAELQVEGALIEQVEAGVVADIRADAEGAGVAVGADTHAQADNPGAGSGTAAVDTRLRTEVNDDGERVERGVWVLLVPDAHAAHINRWGFNVRTRRALSSLGMQVVRVDALENRALSQVALQLALDAPGTVVDYNHVYGTDTGTGRADVKAETCSADSIAPVPLLPPPAAAAPDGETLRIGMIDSAVDTTHPALADARIAQDDFVGHELERPTAHGTAIASLLVGQTPERTGVLPGAHLHAASVVFRDAAGAIGATTDSLLAALDWQRAQGVNIVNMSLSGPANRALEAALDQLAGNGMTVVAAVGNNGPAGAPLYPAAYASVVGVTAVDACRQVFRYANRGDHIVFSALGVDVSVADAAGGYRRESGTSLAAPYVAGLIAAVHSAHGEAPYTVIERLKATAMNLGNPGVDPVYGYGLVRAPLVLAPRAAGSEPGVEHQRDDVF